MNPLCKAEYPCEECEDRRECDIRAKAEKEYWALERYLEEARERREAGL